MKRPLNKNQTKNGLTRVDIYYLRTMASVQLLYTEAKAKTVLLANKIRHHEYTDHIIMLFNNMTSRLLKTLPK